MSKSERRSLEGAQEALAALRPKLMALPEQEVQPFRAPIPWAVATAQRVALSYAEDRARFAATFKPEAFNPTSFDDLPQRALALWQADLELRQIADPEGKIDEALGPAEQLRAKMLKAASYLWENHPRLGSQVAEIKEGRGHLDTADDLAALAGLFEANWHYAKGRCELTREDIEQAQRLSAQLVMLLAQRDRIQDAAERQLAVARELRDRAAAYLRKAIDEIRAGAAYIYRNQPEALERYPSLFASQPRARRQGAAQPPETPAPAAAESV